MRKIKMKRGRKFKNVKKNTVFTPVEFILLYFLQSYLRIFRTCCTKQEKKEKI